MNLRELTSGAKIATLLWIAVSLGSCAIIQNYDNRVMAFSISYPTAKKRCEMFVRTEHLGHHEPLAPDVNPDKMSEEAFTDVVLTHAEKLKEYVDNEKRYLAQDIARHMETCK